MKSIELIIPRPSKCEMTFGQIQRLMGELNSIDPGLAHQYEIHLLEVRCVGLWENEIIIRVVTDSNDDMDPIAKAMQSLSFANGTVPTLHFQRIKLEESFDKSGSKR